MSERKQPETQRLDIWFYYARLAKTRRLCSQFILRGNIRLNGRVVNKPHTLLRSGNILTFALPYHKQSSHNASRICVWRVQQLGIRRGSAREATLLYQEIEEPKA